MTWQRSKTGTLYLQSRGYLIGYVVNKSGHWWAFCDIEASMDCAGPFPSEDKAKKALRALVGKARASV